MPLARALVCLATLLSSWTLNVWCLPRCVATPASGRGGHACHAQAAPARAMLVALHDCASHEVPVFTVAHGPARLATPALHGDAMPVVAIGVRTPLFAPDRSPANTGPPGARGLTPQRI